MSAQDIRSEDNRSEDILSKPQPPPDERLPYGADPNQFLEVRLPPAKGPHPVLLNIHGGFWRSQYGLAHAGHLCQALRAAGVATVNIEYRRVGNPGGGWPGTFEDIRAAYRFLQQEPSRFHLDLDRLVVMGHSAGGQLALCLAAHETSIHQVISLAGVVDLKKAWALRLGSDAVADFLGGKPDTVPDHYREADPMELSIPQSRQWLIHGTEDDTVPPEMSRAYVARKSAKGSAQENSQGKAQAGAQENAQGSAQEKKKTGEWVQLVEIPRAGHYDLIDPASDAFRQVTSTVLTAVGTQLQQ